MAQRVHTILVSDLTGKEIEEGNGETINFSFRGVDYQIDVTLKEAEQFDKSIGKYLEAAQRLGGRRSSGGGRGKAKVDPSQAKAMRRWLQDNGYEVSSRGRIPQELQDVYHAR